jgi:hypothetical protein
VAETEVKLSDRVRRYLETWHSLDPERVRNLYADDATHRGPGVVRFHPDEPDATLGGNDTIVEFAGRVRAGVGSEADFDFVVTNTLEAGDTSVVEYDLPSGDGVQRWVEIVEWDGDCVRHARVYMLPSGA